MLSMLLAHLRNQWIGALALFLVLTGGSAYALTGSNTVFSDDIVDKEVKTADIGPAGVTSGKLAPDAVNSAKIAGGGVTTTDLANAAVTQAKLGPDSVNSRKVVDNSLKGADIDESTLTNVGGGGPAGGDLTGTYPDPLIAPDAVGSDEILDKSIGAADLKETVRVNDAELVPAGGVPVNGVIAQCPAGYIALRGGAYWDFRSGQLSSVTNPGPYIYGDGTNRGQSEQYIRAFADCLPN